jgi:putative FmdB family regulatory protein
MPTYEYRCKSCGCTFDEFHKMNDSEPRKCPECGGMAERKIGTGSGIIFKGSGFHATDYAKGGNGDHGSCGEKKGSCPSGGCCCDDS